MECTVDGCGKVAVTRGLCGTHYTRWKRHGDPAVVLRGAWRGMACSVEGCEKPGNGGGGLCWAHRDMEKRNGDPTARQRASAGTGYTTTNGYRVIRAVGHPVANVKGTAYEHRVVLYDKIGPGEHECVHCGDIVRWEDGTLTSDHLDFDRSNNDPKNLAPCCHRCNVRRTRVAGTTKRTVCAECGAPELAKGLCANHYAKRRRRLKKHQSKGSPIKCEPM